jgi:hypothetical protein
MTIDIEAPPASSSAPPDAWAYAEQRLYDVSPLGLWQTTAVLFALLIGAYALAARADHLAWIVRGPAGADIDHRAWIAISLALIVCSVLSLQRYSRLMEAKEAPAFARAIKADVAWGPTFSKTRLRLFTSAGIAVGAFATLAFLARGDQPRGAVTSVWFTLMSVLLSALFFRGLALTNAAARHTHMVVRTGLRIDLLRIEQLYPFGRAAGRTALIWFTVSAATLLLFVRSGLDVYTIGLGLACAAMGVWVFVGTLGVVHHEIRRAKAAELEALRTEIAAAKQALSDDPAAPAKLQSLLAYEARVDAAPEWPFDQSILVRVGASALILTVPWFGQAFAGLVVDHLGKTLP